MSDSKHTYTVLYPDLPNLQIRNVQVGADGTLMPLGTDSPYGFRKLLEFARWAARTHPAHLLCLTTRHALDAYPDGDRLPTIDRFIVFCDGMNIGSVDTAWLTRTRDYGLRLTNNRITESRERKRSIDTSKVARAQQLYKKYFYALSLNEKIKTVSAGLSPTAQHSKYWAARNMGVDMTAAAFFAQNRDVLNRYVEFVPPGDRNDIVKGFEVYLKAQEESVDHSKFNTNHIVLLLDGDGMVIVKNRSQDERIKELLSGSNIGRVALNDLPDRVVGRYAMLSMAAEGSEKKEVEYISEVGLFNGKAFAIYAGD